MYIVGVVVEGKGAGVESEDYPCVGEMEVDGFDAWGSFEHFLFEHTQPIHTIFYINNNHKK